jgi:predicted peptidase
MKGILLTLAFSTLGLFSCKQVQQEDKQADSEPTAFTEIVQEGYKLYKPQGEIAAVLILFGGYPERAEDIRSAFDILELAKEHRIAVLLSNFNQKLWLEENEQYQLAESLQNIVKEHHLPTSHIYIGGFSSGGVVSLLISNYITAREKFHIDPRGVFIVDSPIDLAALYASSEKNIESNFSDVSVQESTWLLETLNSSFGNPDDNIEVYEDKSVFTYRTGNTDNLSSLKNTKIRLYTEPDTAWWAAHRKVGYEQMNAFYIEQLAERLKERGFDKVQYIPTTNKGFRPNGQRHPHSWSIVDKKELIEWMLEK